MIRELALGLSQKLGLIETNTNNIILVYTMKITCISAFELEIEKKTKF